jgi:LacI family transcriptional regulator
MATINDVARSCGVSPTTVSFVINNGPRPVSAQTRQRVLDAIERLEYRPSAVARGLARQRMETIGVLFSGHNPRIVHNPYAVALLDGVVAAASNLRYNVTLITQKWENAETMAAAVCDGRNDGLLVLSPIMGSELETALAQRNLPLVLVGATAVSPNVPWMDVDNDAGARLAARHLLEMGHRRIALLLGPRNYQHVNQREQGFLTELAAGGVHVPPDYILCGDSYSDGSANEPLAAELLSRPDRPSAILTTSDALAVVVQRVARTLGLSVPDDLSVTGFDDASGFPEGISSLTTVRQPLFEIGYTAAERLIQSIETKDGEKGRQSALFPPELIVRHSTARLPSPGTSAVAVHPIMSQKESP